VAKNHCIVDFPFLLNMSNFQYFPKQECYKLSSVVVHIGDSYQSGHYVVYRNCQITQPTKAGKSRDSNSSRSDPVVAAVQKREKPRDFWLRISDADVRFVEEHEVAAAQAYMLFYQLI